MDAHQIKVEEGKEKVDAMNDKRIARRQKSHTNTETEMLSMFCKYSYSFRVRKIRNKQFVSGDESGIRQKEQEERKEQERYEGKNGICVSECVCVCVCMCNTSFPVRMSQMLTLLSTS